MALRCRVFLCSAGQSGLVGLVKFSTTMFQMGNNTGIEVPDDVVAALDASHTAVLAKLERRD